MYMSKYEWDKKKDLHNIQKHGISFSEASHIFDNPILSKIDDRLDYKEIRHISIGEIKNIIVMVVVHTDRSNKLRIISARKANKKERDIYTNFLKGVK